MSFGILALKIGLITAVTGVSIATPILLNRGYEVSSVVSLDSSEVESPTLEATPSGTRREEAANADRSTESEPRMDEPRLASDVDNGSHVTDPEPASSPSEREDNSGARSEEPHANAEGAVQRTSDSGNTLGASLSTSAVSQPLTTKFEEFNKECFIVPAESTKGDSIELLTCYNKGNRIQADAGESDEELESLFHLYDKGGSNNPVLIDGSLIWNPTNKQLTAKLTKNTDTNSEYIFKATREHWGNISNKSINLLQGKGECAIYKATLKEANSNSTHLLTCGKDSEEYDSSDPKGIPLSLWKQK